MMVVMTGGLPLNDCSYNMSDNDKLDVNTAIDRDNNYEQCIVHLQNLKLK